MKINAFSSAKLAGLTKEQIKAVILKAAVDFAVEKVAAGEATLGDAILVNGHLGVGRTFEYDASLYEMRVLRKKVVFQEISRDDINVEEVFLEKDDYLLTLEEDEEGFDAADGSQAHEWYDAFIAKTLSWLKEGKDFEISLT